MTENSKYFGSNGVDPRDTPEELFFVTNKSHPKPLGKGHKINDKQPFPRGIMNTHNIISKFGIEMK